MCALARYGARWTDFEAACRAGQLSTAQLLAAVALPATSRLTGAGAVPWTETLIAGIRRIACEPQAADVAAAAVVQPQHREEFAAWLRQQQRRWHPDRLQSLLLRRASDEGVAVNAAAVQPQVAAFLQRVTAVAQSINSLKEKVAAS
jgi:hypothetical protein